MKASVLEFCLGEEIFCFNTKDIAYVFELEEYTDFQGINPAVLGVARYNNDVMPLVDTLYLYSQKHLQSKGEKSVVVIKDEGKNIYGMVVDEILKIEELDVVYPTVDMNSEDLVINHYKDKEKIVNEIYPLLLLKKQNIMAMQQDELAQTLETEVKKRQEEYLLFTIENHYYAVASRYVKEVVESRSEIFELISEEGRLQGAIAVRDEVINIAKIGEMKNSGSVIIVESEAKKVALLVDEIFDIETFELSKIENLHDQNLAMNAFYNFDNNVVGIINIDYFIKNIEAHSSEVVLDNEQKSSRKEYLSFRMQERRFAIDMKNVRQVVETEMLSKTESSSIIANSNIKFITTWNKMAVSVADISALVGVDNIDIENSQTIFISDGKYHMAFLIDEVEDIIYLQPGDIKSSSENESIIGGAVLVDDDFLVTINEHFLVSMC